MSFPRRVVVGHGYEWEYWHAAGLLQPADGSLTEAIRRFKVARPIFIVDPIVYKLYRAEIDTAVEQHAGGIVLRPSRAGEQMKCMDEYLLLSESVLAHGPDKGDTIIAMGGGALHDLAGYVAGTVRRGVMPYMVIPTTLAAMIDAALSPKVGINVGRSKNGLGIKHPPLLVLWSQRFLKTLDLRSVRTGMAEMLKIAVSSSSNLVDVLELGGAALMSRRFQDDVGAEVIDAAASSFLRLQFLSPRPASLRAYGHGFSRAIEGASKYKLSHGEAISTEMAIVGTLAQQLGMLDKEECDRLLELIVSLGLPLICRESTIDVIWPVFKARYERNQPFDLVALRKLGQADFLDRFTEADLRAAINVTAARAAHFS